jgi:hypothetical protein
LGVKDVHHFFDGTMEPEFQGDYSLFEISVDDAEKIPTMTRTSIGIKPGEFLPNFPPA